MKSLRDLRHWLVLVSALGAAVLVAGQDSTTESAEELTERVPDSWLRPVFIEEEEQPLTERVPDSWLRPLPPVDSDEPQLTERVPEAWLRPVLPEEPANLTGSAGAQGLEGRLPPPPDRETTVTKLQDKWFTPLQLFDEPQQQINSDTSLPDFGRFEIKNGVAATFSSPGYPDKYPPFVWTTWKFEPEEGDATLRLSCDVFELESGDFLVVRSQDGGRQIFHKRSGSPDLTSSEFIQVELRTNQLVHGRVRCSVRASSGGANEVQRPRPPTTTTEVPKPTTVRPVTSSGTSSSPVPVNAPNCGKTKYDTRIVGGEPAPENAYPWLAGLVTRNGRSPFCGGSIINERFILTAAHCVNGRTPSRVKIVVRKHKRSSDPNEKRYTVKRIIMHPNYNRNTQDSDLALIEINGNLRSLILNKDGRVGTICLPRAACGGGSGARCYEDRTAVLAGWGVLRSGSLSTPATVQHVRVPIMTNAACKADYAKDRIGITNNMICAGLAAGGKDSCQGDSGGPMMTHDSNNIYTLSGVVSFGKGCAAPGYPGVYARVSEFLNWIKTTSKL